jgi:hypothetical protein
MTHNDWIALTPQQRQAMREMVGIREPEDMDQPDKVQELNALIEKAYAPGPPVFYVGIPDWKGMFVGIEPDGYRHT